MRLLICAGGTGGGVYPALAVWSALVAEAAAPDGAQAPDRPEVLWVGGIGGMEADLVKRAGVRFEGIPAAGVHGVGLRALPGNLAQLGRGFLAARRLLQDFRPHALFFTGGFVAVPVALAARSLGLPTRSLLYVPDIEPGLALKTLARFADRIAITTEDSRPYFKRSERLALCGYPTRPELNAWADPGRRAEARQRLGLAPDLPALLVFGGSKGARSINRALLPALPALLPEMQVVHLSGQLDWPEVEAQRDRLAGSLSAELLARYHAYPYLHEEMGAALAAADLAVSRAGASVLGEFPLFGLPAVLAPYPFAWRYQHQNAQYLAQRGAAQIIVDAQLPDQLADTARRLLGDPAGLGRMRAAMRSLAHPQAAREIAGLLMTESRTASDRDRGER